MMHVILDWKLIHLQLVLHAHEAALQHLRIDSGKTTVQPWFVLQCLIVKA